MFDLHITWNGKHNDFLKANKDGLELIASVPNQRYAPIEFEPFSADKLRRFQTRPDQFQEHRSIDVYFSAEPCKIPDSWRK